MILPAVCLSGSGSLNKKKTRRKGKEEKKRYEGFTDKYTNQYAAPQLRIKAVVRLMRNKMLIYNYIFSMLVLLETVYAQLCPTLQTLTN